MNPLPAHHVMSGPPPDVVPGHVNRPKNRLHDAVKYGSREGSRYEAAIFVYVILLQNPTMLVVYKNMGRSSRCCTGQHSKLRLGGG